MRKKNFIIEWETWLHTEWLSGRREPYWIFRHSAVFVIATLSDRYHHSYSTTQQSTVEGTFGENSVSRYGSIEFDFIYSMGTIVNAVIRLIVWLISNGDRISLDDVDSCGDAGLLNTDFSNIPFNLFRTPVMIWMVKKKYESIDLMIWWFDYSIADLCERVRRSWKMNDVNSVWNSRQGCQILSDKYFLFINFSLFAAHLFNLLGATRWLLYVWPSFRSSFELNSLWQSLRSAPDCSFPSSSFQN